MNTFSSPWSPAYGRGFITQPYFLHSGFGDLLRQRSFPDGEPSGPPGWAPFFFPQLVLHARWFFFDHKFDSRLAKMTSRSQLFERLEFCLGTEPRILKIGQQMITDSVFGCVETASAGRAIRRAEPFSPLAIVE
jgi:hypothetical protein